jgi:DNA-3-methyladenine glycosylase II
VLRRRPRDWHDPAAHLSDDAAATEYLRGQDPVLRDLIDVRGPIDPETDRRGSRPDPYIALSRAIVGQQLSTKAAASIWARFEALFRGPVEPRKVVAAREDRLRSAGLSNSKVAYLKDLARRVHRRELDLDRIGALPDEDVIAELTAIKGIGRWTAEMFLIFHLGRPDVLSAGDLGIRRAVQIAYQLEDLPGPTDLERLAEPWRPQRTLACLYLWRSLDNVPG